MMPLGPFATCNVHGSQARMGLHTRYVRSCTLEHYFQRIPSTSVQYLKRGVHGNSTISEGHCNSQVCALQQLKALGLRPYKDFKVGDSELRVGAS
jgi:hypothetical protein